MSIETELKLRIAPQQLARLKRHALLKTHQLSRPVTRHLYNIYFDTPKLDLQQAAMALRLRRSGKQWLQTLKEGGSVQGGLHRRNEWEVPVAGPELDFKILHMVDYIDNFKDSLIKKLQPVFVTDFSRNSRMIEWQGAQIEVCMDQGEVSTEHARAPLCELELELKSGEPAQLFEFALAIINIVPFELETISKAEQGYRLFGGYTVQAVKASTVKLDKHESLSASLQTLIWAVMQQLQANVHGAMGADSAEYIHQMRVAIRRLRVLLRMAESVCADEQLTGFKQEFSALGVALGKIREWDVFIAEIVQGMCASMPDDEGLQVLKTSSEQQRDASYALFNNDAQVREIQRLMLRFAIWMNGAYWQKRELDGLDVRNFAKTYLSRLAGLFGQAGENPITFDADKLHAMRIHAKKLRYCAEFFATLYGKHKFRLYVAALSNVQVVLGQIHDDAVAQHLLDELSAIPTLAAHQDTIALVRGWIAHELSGQFAVLDEATRSFQEQQRFWVK